MRLIFHDELASTQIEAKRLAKAGDYGPLWIMARRQSAGRGRLDRQWISQEGNLFCTGLYPFDGALKDLPKLSFIAALAVVDMLKNYIPKADISLKWPNDVLVGGAKISGILLESGQSEAGIWVAIGIGVNLISHPDDIDREATHILTHIDTQELDDPEPVMTGPEPALALLARKYDHWLDMFTKDGFVPIAKAWTEQMAYLDEPIAIKQTEHTYVGIMRGVGVDGELQLETDNGSLLSIWTGDITTPIIKE